ncbi:hypothetical protein Drorol1_Dr00026231 [Drosera rotundifolia]
MTLLVFHHLNWSETTSRSWEYGEEKFDRVGRRVREGLIGLGGREVVWRLVKKTLSGGGSDGVGGDEGDVEEEDGFEDEEEEEDIVGLEDIAGEIPTARQPL